MTVIVMLMGGSRDCGVWAVVVLVMLVVVMLVAVVLLVACVVMGR